MLPDQAEERSSAWMPEEWWAYIPGCLLCEQSSWATRQKPQDDAHEAVHPEDLAELNSLPSEGQLSITAQAHLAATQGTWLDTTHSPA